MPEKNDELETDVSQDQGEKKKVQAWISSELHRKMKGYSGFFALDAQDFVAIAIAEKIENIEWQIREGKIKMIDIL